MPKKTAKHDGMNPHAVARAVFLDKYFPYPESLERAIRAGEPRGLVMKQTVGTEVFRTLCRYDTPLRLVRLLDRYSFRQDYRWEVTAPAVARLHDWAALVWEREAGLWLRMETMEGHEPADREQLALFQRARKAILGNFLGGIHIAHCGTEDLSLKLTDGQLHRLGGDHPDASPRQFLATRQDLGARSCLD